MLKKIALVGLLIGLPTAGNADNGVDMRKVPCHSMIIYCLYGFNAVREGGQSNLDNYCKPTKEACNFAVEACTREAMDPTISKLKKDVLEKVVNAAKAMQVSVDWDCKDQPAGPDKSVPIEELQKKEALLK